MTGDVCPYCRTKIVAEDVPMACEGCGTPHHADCYAENGGCTIFGCSKAPGDEPKMQVSTPELVAAGTPTAPTAVPERRTAPPPPPGAVAAATATVSVPPPVATEEDIQAVARRVVPSMFGGFTGDVSSEPEPQPEPLPPRKRTNFIMLGALLGAFGAHNFYAGYYKKAGFQLAITLLTLGFASPMSWMWAVIDICTINKDSRGVVFES
ncbi:MAG: RING finger protein [Terriglobales bacterium]